MSKGTPLLTRLTKAINRVARAGAEPGTESRRADGRIWVKQPSGGWEPKPTEGGGAGAEPDELTQQGQSALSQAEVSIDTAREMEVVPSQAQFDAVADLPSAELIDRLGQLDESMQQREDPRVAEELLAVQGAIEERLSRGEMGGPSTDVGLPGPDEPSFDLGPLPDEGGGGDEPPGLQTPAAQKFEDTIAQLEAEFAPGGETSAPMDPFGEGRLRQLRQKFTDAIGRGDVTSEDAEQLIARFDQAEFDARRRSDAQLGQRQESKSKTPLLTRLTAMVNRQIRRELGKPEPRAQRPRKQKRRAAPVAKPVPTPNAGETQDDFIGRCMSAMPESEGPQAQRLAICFSQYREGKAAKGESLTRVELLKEAQQNAVYLVDLADRIKKADADERMEGVAEEFTNDGIDKAEEDDGADHRMEGPMEELTAEVIDK